MRFAVEALMAGVSLVGSAMLASCLVDDPNHCANKRGHASCTEDGFPFCSRCVKSSERGGCVSQAPTEDACMLDDDDGGVAATAGSSGTATDPTATDDDMMSTGPTGCTQEGLRDDACPATTPYCLGGTCAGCDAGGEGFCAGAESGLPVCGSAGACVECSLEDAGACGDGEFCSPVGVCGGCTSHDQCAPAGCTGNECQACNLESGACFSGNVFWVDRDDCVEGTENGTPDEPYCEVALAMANVSAQDSFTVRVVPSRTPYAGPVTLQASGTKRVAVVGHGGRPTFTGSSYAGNVSTSSNRLFLSHLVLDGGTIATVRCASGRLWLDDVIVRGGPVGVRGENCTRLSISGSIVTGADEVGVSVNGQVGSSALRIVNTAVLGNGDDVAASGGIVLAGVSDWTIDYSTIIGNLREASLGGSGLRCATDSPGAARNSIFLSGQGTSAIDCPAGTFDQVVSDVMNLFGDGNVYRSYMLTDFGNPAVGDAHLKPDADPEIFRIGVWREGDPPTDVDGELRPLVDGAADWVGFDTLPR